MAQIKTGEQYKEDTIDMKPRLTTQLTNWLLVNQLFIPNVTVFKDQATLRNLNIPRLETTKQIC